LYFEKIKAGGVNLFARDIFVKIFIYSYVRVNYREGGLYVIYSPEDAQRPRAVYHIQPNFEVIN
jgi:hypothetical protein